MAAKDLFSEFDRFGDQILHGIEKDERAARKYKYLLGKINELMHTTHGMVVEKLERIEKADQPEEAEAVLAELRSDALEESFRLEGLCDVFEAYGNTLAELTWSSESDADSVASGSNLRAIQDFALMLGDREREVARIYNDEIKAMANLFHHDGDLSSIKSRATAAKKVLTDQMTDFSAKSERFTHRTQ